VSSTGHEDEFRALFAQEAQERLSALASQLLALEESGADADLVASIFREAHTLKGAAAVVGMTEVSSVAHVMEDLLEGVRSGTRPATPELIDALLAAVDGLASMVPAVLAGEDRTSEASVLEHALRQHGGGPAEPVEEPAPPEPSPEPEPQVVTATEPEPPGDAPVSAPRAAPATDSETARVPVARLDEIVRLVGESAAANLRVGRMI